MIDVHRRPTTVAGPRPSIDLAEEVGLRWGPRAVVLLRWGLNECASVSIKRAGDETNGTEGRTRAAEDVEVIREMLREINEGG